MAFRTTQRSRPSYAQGYARSAAQAANPGLWNRLAGAWFPSLGPTGERLNDLSGHDNHGALTSMDAATDWILGDDGYVLDFDGSNDYVAVQRQFAGLDNFQPWSVAWRSKCRVANPTAEGIFMFWGTDNGIGDDQNFGAYHWDNDTNGVYVIHQNGSSKHLTICATAITQTIYNSFVAVFDGVALVLYVNGKENSQAGSGNPSLGTYSETRFGVQHQSFLGQIDLQFIAAWDRPLLFSEIQQLHIDPHAIVRRRITIPVADQAAPTTNINTQQKRMSVVGVGRPWLRSAFPGAKNQAWRQARGSIYAGNPVAAPPSVGGGRNIVLGGGVF